MHIADSYLAGWRLRPTFPIPELLPWTGEERHPDIAIFTARIPECPADLVIDSPLLRIARNGACWFQVPGIAEYFVSDDATEIIVAANADVPSSAARTFLLSTVFVLLCHKRRLTPIHASCVEIGGRAVAFAGPSCAGKSLLAAAFMKAGCTILSDDISVIDTAGVSMALPSFPRLRLWRDALDRFGLNGSDPQQSRPEMEKYDISSEHAFIAEPRRLEAIYYLRPQRKGIAESTTRLQGAAALRYAAQALACGQAGRALGDEAGALQRLSTLCAGTSSYVLAFQPGFDALESRVAALLAERGQRS